MSRRRVHVLISGRVQGVGFRFHAQREAERLGLDGWMRNLPDGRVEACFEADAETVEAMLVWARGGPPSAHVEALDVHETECTGERAGFHVRG